MSTGTGEQTTQDRGDAGVNRDIHTRGRRYVAGRGNPQHGLMIVGEAPGKQEQATGRPFVGKTGKEMARLLRQAGLDIRQFYLTNVCKYRPFTRGTTGNSPPTAADIERDTPDLIAEIKECRPDWIIAVGRTAAIWFMEDDDLDLEDVEWFAFPDLPRAQGAVVVVVRHPAAGFHSPEQQPHIFKGFQRAGQYIRGEIEPVPPVNEYPEPDYDVIENRLIANVSGQRIAVDTEGLYGRAWCLTFSDAPGTATMVLRKNEYSMRLARELLLKNKLALHNAPHDLRILAELFDMPLLDLLYRVDFEDTMQMAYVLRLMPKGLKSLGRQFKGVHMRSYRSVVADADREIMLEWYRDVLRERCRECDGLGSSVQEPVSEKTGKKLQPRLVNCEVCEGDGLNWDPPTASLGTTSRGKLSISRGRRMGWRVRKIVEDRDKPEVDLRKRWEDLKRKDYQFGQQVEDRMGAPREVSLGDVPFDEALHYACQDADVTMRIWPDLERELDVEESKAVGRALTGEADYGTGGKGSLRQVYEMDRNIIPMLTMMMHVGWKIDTTYLNKLTNKLEIQQDKIMYRLERLTGREINPASQKQVGEYLFGVCGLEPVKYTNSGLESTDNKVLSDLRIYCNQKPNLSLEYKVISLLLDHRELNKLKTTYTIPLPKMADEQGRLHTQFKGASVESGRLASADPNLQNIPSRTANGRKIRHAFTCEPGRVLVSVDYGQVEMRVLAHESHEEKLIQAIIDGLDVHNLTTSMIFGIPYDEVRKDMWQRDASKTLGFGIVYGISAPALKTQIKLQSAKHTAGGVDVSVERCEEWIDMYVNTTYPRIGEFMLDSQAEARRYGFVEDMFGRRRYLPGAHSVIGSVRAESERIATNHKIQAGAQGIIKLAMTEIWQDVLPRFRKRGFAECICQIHDELVFEVDEELAEDLKTEVEKTMRGVMKLAVPLEAEGRIAKRWDRLKG